MLGLLDSNYIKKINMIFQTIIVPTEAAALAEASSPAFRMNPHKGKLV